MVWLQILTLNQPNQEGRGKGAGPPQAGSAEPPVSPKHHPSTFQYPSSAEPGEIQEAAPGADWRHPLWDWHLQSPSTPRMLLGAGTSL